MEKYDTLCKLFTLLKALLTTVDITISPVCFLLSQFIYINLTVIVKL